MADSVHTETGSAKINTTFWIGPRFNWTEQLLDRELLTGQASKSPGRGGARLNAFGSITIITCPAGPTWRWSGWRRRGNCPDGVKLPRESPTLEALRLRKLHFRVKNRCSLEPGTLFGLVPSACPWSALRDGRISSRASTGLPLGGMQNIFQKRLNLADLVGR